LTAHAIALDKGFGKYETLDILHKARILADVKVVDPTTGKLRHAFSPSEIRTLMENGVTGNFAEKAVLTATIEKMKQNIDRAIADFVAKNDVTFITYPVSESSLIWIERGVATTKATDIKLKTVKGDTIFAGMIREDNNITNKSRFSDKAYQAEIDKLDPEKYTLLNLTYNGKTAVETYSKEKGKWEEAWVPTSEISKIGPNSRIPKVIVDKKTNKYVVSDLDGLFVADKSNNTEKFTQKDYVLEWGPDQSEAHAVMAREINAGMPDKSVPLIRHSFTHSWDQVEDITFPLTAYSKNSKVMIEDLPQFWKYLQKQEKAGFKIRANCRWALPIEIELRKFVQKYREEYCPKL
jgi:hypothetical protein